MPQYKIIELKESLIGGKVSGGRLEKVLNAACSDGCVTYRKAHSDEIESPRTWLGSRRK